MAIISGEDTNTLYKDQGEKAAHVSVNSLISLKLILCYAAKSIIAQPFSAHLEHCKQINPNFRITTYCVGLI